jgi:hypothetical protein
MFAYQFAAKCKYGQPSNPGGTALVWSPYDPQLWEISIRSLTRMLVLVLRATHSFAQLFHTILCVVSYSRALCSSPRLSVYVQMQAATVEP